MLVVQRTVVRTVPLASDLCRVARANSRRVRRARDRRRLILLYIEGRVAARCSLLAVAEICGNRIGTRCEASRIDVDGLSISIHLPAGCRIGVADGALRIEA